MHGVEQQKLLSAEEGDCLNKRRDSLRQARVHAQHGSQTENDVRCVHIGNHTVIHTKQRAWARAHAYA